MRLNEWTVFAPDVLDEASYRTIFPAENLADEAASSGIYETFRDEYVVLGRGHFG